MRNHPASLITFTSYRNDVQEGEKKQFEELFPSNLNFVFRDNKVKMNSSWITHPVHHFCTCQPILALLLMCQPIIFEISEWSLSFPLVGIISWRDCVHAPFQGSLCGLLCCCIFYSIRIFGKLWPLQQVNDVGNFSFLIIIFSLFCLDLWQAFSLGTAVYECLNALISPAFSRTVYTSEL